MTKTRDFVYNHGFFGASVGARTRTEGVGGLYGIQFHHGCILSFKRIYRPVVTKTYPAEAVANFVR